MANVRATFDFKGKCDQCESDLWPHTNLVNDEYYKCAIRSAIFREIVRRKDNAYVAHIIVKATCSNIPAHFMDRFMEQVANAGRRENAEQWDKEGPRV